MISDGLVFIVVQSLSCVWLFVTPWTAARQASLFITNSWNMLKLMSIESVMLFSHLALCCPLSSLLQSSPAPGSFLVSQFFESGGQSIGFQLQYQSFQWIFWIDFLYDWLVWSCSARDSQESSPTTQFKSINSSVLSFKVQLSHPYMTNGMSS